MSRHSSLPIVLARAMLCLALHLGSCALAQSAPLSWSHPWHTADEQEFVRQAVAEHKRKPPQNSVRTYTLAELIDVAESNNPETRVAWERAPSFDILGSFFPAWLLCFIAAILLTAASRELLRRYVELAWPVVTYPSLTALFAFGLWLTFFH